VREFLEGVRLQWQLLTLTPMTIISACIGPAAYSLIIATQTGVSDAALVVGTGALGLWQVMLTMSLLAIMQERRFGTLPLLTISPTPVWLPLAGRMAGALLQGLLALPLAYVWIRVVLGNSPFGSLWLAAAAVVILVGGLASLVCGLMGFLARHRFAAGMTNGAAGVVVLISALFIPVSALPGALALVAKAFPAAWGMTALRSGATVDLAVGAAVELPWLVGALVYLQRTEAYLRRHPDAQLL
jgi:ABC-2 type transport system permease protein